MIKIKLFKELINFYQQYSLFSQKSLAKKSTYEAIQSFNLEEYLKIYHSIDNYCYFIADVSSMEIVKVSSSIKSLMGFEASEFEGKKFSVFLNIHPLADLIKLSRGGIAYFDYLYKQPKQNRPYIKANFTIDLKTKNGPSIHVLGQSIPVLFNEEMEVIYCLNIITDISDLKTDRSFTHYILDTSDENNVKKIKTKFRNEFPSSKSPISGSEKKVLLLMAEGKSSKQIADLLYLSEHTVKNHRKKMLKKIGCASSSELVRTSIMNGWL